MLLGFVVLLGCENRDFTSLIYQPGREVGYVISYLDANDSTVCEDSVTLRVLEPGLLDIRSKLTDQVTNEFIYHGPCSEKHTETTGIKETDKRLFLHPPRSGNMIVTELGAFPQIFHPAKIGKGGSGSLEIQHGYGDWDGNTVPYQDSVTMIVDSTIAGNDYKDCIVRSGIAEPTPIGPVETHHIFDEKYGWIQGEWQFDTARIVIQAYEFNW